MKLFMSIVAYLIIGAFLGTGMVQLMKGSPWLLIISFVAYVIAFSVIGCLPKKSH